MFLIHTIGIIPNLAGHLKTPEVGWHVPAAERRADFQSRKAIQGSIKHHVSEKDGGLERVPEDVAEDASSLASIELHHVFRGLRMHDNNDAHFLRRSPDRKVFGICEVLALH